MGTARGFEGFDSGQWQSVESTVSPLTRAQHAEQRLGFKLWPKMSLLFELLDLGVQQLLIRSCNGAGKSIFLATTAIQEITRHDNIQLICSGANAAALKNTLWRNVKRVAKIGNISVDKFTDQDWQPTPNRSMIAVAPSKVEGAQGYHASRVCALLDEATGLSMEKITGLLSNATGAQNVIIMTYNPINPDAAVFSLEQESLPLEALLDEDGHLLTEAVRTAIDSSAWISVGISAFDHPNVITGHEVIPGAITRDYVERMLRVNSDECDYFYPGAIQLEWCNKAYLPTPEALARVCGQWSEQQTVGFISGSVIVEAWKSETKVGLKVAGADIGGGQDPSMWTHFDGNQQFPFESITTSELGVVANKLHEYCMEHDIDAIGIDDSGIGHGVTDRLQERDTRYKVLPINGASAPKMFPETRVRNPLNARCEMYLMLEKEMRAKQIRIVYDKDLQKELSAQKFANVKNEKLRLEDKNLIRRRLGRSPDKADATAIARYTGHLLQFYNRPKLLL